MIEAKTFKPFIRIYSLFKSERLSANIKLTLHKALTRSVMTYDSPAWALAADIYLLKLHLMQNKVLRIGQDEDRHRKYKRLKLGGDQSYDRLAAIIP
jgi:hypothetical protein